MDKIKILFVIESLCTGGAEKSLVTLLNEIDYKKYDVDLILFKEGGVFFKEIPKEVNLILKKLPFISLIDRVGFKVRKIIKGQKYHSAQILWSIIKDKFEFFEVKYDVAVAYSQGFSTYYVSKFVKANKKYAWLNTDYKKAGYNVDFDLPIYREFKAIITVSPEVKEGLQEALKSKEISIDIKVIKDISDQKTILKKSEEKLDFKFDNNKNNIVTVARLAKPKGLHLAVESCKKLLDKGYKIHWYIVGEGLERKKIETLVKRYQLENAFSLVGESPNPYPYVKKSDVYVQTSIFEGLGLSVIEAAYLNKPIVCTNFPTAFGILEHEVTGLICEMDSALIANQIERLILDESLKNKLVTNLAKQENKDKEKTLQQIEELLKI